MEHMVTEATSNAGRMADVMRETFEAYVSAQNRGDAKAAAEFIHKGSPTYESARQMLHQLYLNYKLRSELLGVHFVGADDVYAYVRVRQLTEKIEGPEFRDNVTDALIVLREDEGAWKIWNQVLLHAEVAQRREAAGDE